MKNFEKFNFEIKRYNISEECEAIREYIDGFFCLPKEQKRVEFFLPENGNFETYQTRLTDEYLAEQIKSKKEFKIRVVGYLNPDTLKEQRDEYIFIFRAYKNRILCGDDLIVE